MIKIFCDFCGEHFHTTKLLTNHEKRCDIKNLTVANCDHRELNVKLFSQPRGLDLEAVIRNRNTSNWVECDKCKKRFYLNKNLLMHDGVVW